MLDNIAHGPALGPLKAANRAFGMPLGAGLMVRRIYPRLLLPCGHVPPGCRHVLVEQLSHGDPGVLLPSGLRERKQLAELDLRGALGLLCLANPFPGR